MTRGLRFVASGADKVMPLLAERGLWKPPTDHDLRGRLGLPERV